MYISTVKSQRFQLRLTPETYRRIKQLANEKHTSMAQVIEFLVDEAWTDNYILPGFKKNE